MAQLISIPALTTVVMLALAPAAVFAAAETGPVAATARVVARPDSAGQSIVRQPLTAEEKALNDVRQRGVDQVRTLVANTRGLPDGPARRALQHKVEEVKRTTEVEFLRVKIQFARQRGDLAMAQECQHHIDLILNPPKAAPGRATPEPPAGSAKEGGRP